MTTARFAGRLGREHWPAYAGALGSVAVAIAIYTRFSINGRLDRDESVYVYGGQQLVHGVPPYASIFDLKAPGATMLIGLAAAIARVLGRNDLHVIRLVFLGCSVLTVLAIYLLVVQLWGSVLAGLAAAVVFTSFWGFATDALAGPDAKTPGVLCTVVSMLLLARRHWFWGAFVASLAFLVWQPFAVYPLVAVVAALVGTERDDRRRALVTSVGGAVLPVAVVTVYFAIAGALGKFVEAALVFPLTGVRRLPPETFVQRLRHIASVVHAFYKFSGILFWVGLVLAAGLVAVRLVRGRDALGSTLREPLVLVVAITLLGQVAYAASDFQGYPDLLPLLPYAAIGFGGAVAVGLSAAAGVLAAQRCAIAATLATLTVLTAFTWVWFSDDPSSHDLVRAEQADACGLERLLAPGAELWSLGDPTPLVLTHRRNPDRFIYLGSGVSQWKISHTHGGFDGWTAQIAAVAPPVVVLQGWFNSPVDRPRIAQWLRANGYRATHVGRWYVFLSPQGRARAKTVDVRTTPEPTDYAMSATGAELPATCQDPRR